MNSTPERPIIDGLMYNPLLRYLPMRFLPLAYERLKPFRTGAWQPRLYTAPAGNGGAVIPAGTTQSQQVRMSVSGCYLIGYMMATLTDTPASFGVVVIDADVDISGEGTAAYGGYSFADGSERYVIGSAFTPASYVGASGASGQRWVSLTKPYKVIGDLLSIKLSNQNVNDDVQVQFVLYVMEPFSVS